MTELALVWLFPIKWSVIGAFTFLYMIGGRENKAIRRLGGGLFLAFGLFGLSMLKGFNLRLILACCTVPFGLFLGYGGDDFKTKFIRRFLYGLVLGLSGLTIGILSGHVVLGCFQLVLAVQASLALGLLNPDDAVDEESLIAILSVVFLPFMVA